jgi:hypothetical protein
LSQPDEPGASGAPTPTHELSRAAARHGSAVPRGQTLAPGTGGGRFGRMFGFLPLRDPGAEAIWALFCLLKAKSEETSNFNDNIPAGYTYLGQFIDHDITFDPTSMLGRDNDPRALVNFRTPRFDLDSLYGSGPKDQPFLYDWDCEHEGVKLLVGHNPDDLSLPCDLQPAPVDLPRNQQGRALIGDARNDENLIVSQIHLLFIHFHNKVVDRLCEHHPHPKGMWLFEEARRIVRWHYQWIVVHDFLKRLVGQTMAHRVLQPAAPGGAPTIERRFYTWQDEPFIPVEFSAAAFRCGHSMVRDEYPPKKLPDTHNHPILRPHTDHGLHFGGFRRLPQGIAIDWERFFNTTLHAPEMSFKIDPRISPALFSLPSGDKPLPLLNLRRGRALGLPAGRDVARAMGVDPLSFEQLGLNDACLSTTCADTLLRATPLWYYILCEAKELGMGEHAYPIGLGGYSLGPVGGRIVAEVLVGLLEGDPQSYLRQWPAWTPADCRELLSHPEDRPILTMPDLVLFATPPPAAPPAGAHA